MQDPATSRTSRRRLTITIIFCGALLLQGIYAFVVRPEPYPAVRMPAFMQAAASDGTFPTTVATIEFSYADGSTVHPEVSELLNDFRYSVTRSSFDYMFKPPASHVDADVLDWLRVRAMQLGNGAEPTSVTFTWRKTAVDLRTAEYLDGGATESTELEL